MIINIIFIAFLSPIMQERPILVEAHFWSFRPSLAGFAGSNPSGCKDICLLRVLCVVR